jgi:pentatricopeptide repeat domain-containing protein 1
MMKTRPDPPSESGTEYRCPLPSQRIARRGDVQRSARRRRIARLLPEMILALSVSLVAVLASLSLLLLPCSQALSSSAAHPRTLRNSQSMDRQPLGAVAVVLPVERQIVEAGRKGHTDYALSLYYDLVSQQRQQQQQNPLSSPRMMTIRHVNAAVDACARARPVRFDTALQLIQQATSGGDDFMQLQPNVYTLGALLSAAARAGDCHAAVYWLHHLGHVKPNAVCYHTAIYAAARAKPVPELATALQLLQEAVETKVPVTVIGYNAVLAAAAKLGDWQTAVQLVQNMTGTSSGAAIPRPDAVTYGTLLAACEQAEEWELLLEYADRMLQSDVNVQWDGLACMCILHAAQQLKRPGRALHALQVLKDLDRSNTVTTTTTTAVVAATTGNVSTTSTRSTGWKQTRSTAGWHVAGQRPPLTAPDAVAYRMAISACARGGAWQDGIRLLHELEESTALQADVVAYTCAITGCEYAGEWQKAFWLLDRMRKNNVEPNQVTLAAVIGACATACAKQTLQLKTSVGDNEGSSRISTMPLPQEKALRLLRVLKKDDSVVNPNIQVFNAAIRTCAEAMDLSGAFKVYYDMLDSAKEQQLQDSPLVELDQPLLKPNVITYGSLMTACERVGSMEAVSKVFKLMKDDSDVHANEIIYGAAISACRKAADPERSFLLLRKMIQEGLAPNVATFNTVLTAQTEESAKSRQMANNKAMERAMLVFKLLRSRQCKSAQPNRQSYNILIRAFTAQQQPGQAEALLRLMGQDGFKPDVDLYTAAVTAYERLGQPLRALRLMESMRADGYDFYEVPVLNTAFKKAVKLANVVGGQSFLMNSLLSDERSTSNLFGDTDSSDILDQFAADDGKSQL